MPVAAWKVNYSAHGVNPVAAAVRTGDSGPVGERGHLARSMPAAYLHPDQSKDFRVPG